MNQELIRRFFCNQCTVAEAQAVAKFFKEFPEALDAYMSDGEWQSFIPEELPLPGVADKMLQAIEKHIPPEEQDKKTPAQPSPDSKPQCL